MIITLYRVACDQCGRKRVLPEPTAHEAVAKAVQAGWTSYPLLCPPCARPEEDE